MPAPGQNHLERRLPAILAVELRRREFIAGSLFAALMGTAQAQHPAKAYRIAVVHPSNPVSDPVAFGIVTNLARPGGNITGTSTDAGVDVWSKRLEILKEAVPSASRVAFLASKFIWEAPMAAVLRDAAERMQVSLIGPPLES